MSTVMIELPAVIQENLEAGGWDIPQKALELLAVDGYRRAAISASQVGEMLGLDYWATRAFLTEHHVYPQYGMDDLMQDIENLKRLGRW